VAKLGDSWGAEEELLHPRGPNGRFINKAGVGMLTAVAKRIAQLLARIDYREFGSDGQASQYLFNDYKDWPEADKRRLLADLHDTNVQLQAGRMDPSTKKFVDMMDAQLQPAGDDLILHRTMGPEAFGIDPAMMDAEDGGVWDLPGKVVSSKGYTPSRIGTPGTGGPIHMAIVAPKGTKIAPTRNGPNDRGVMMDRDLPIRITKVDRDGRGGYHVTAIVDTEGGGEEPHPLQGTERETGATPEMREARSTARSMSPAGRQQEQEEAREQQRVQAFEQRQREGTLAPPAPGPTDTGPGGPPPRNEPILKESVGGGPSQEPRPSQEELGRRIDELKKQNLPSEEMGRRVDELIRQSREQQSTPPVPEEPVRTVDFRAAFDEAGIGAPSDGPRRRQFNKAYEGVTSGKRRPEDALRELEADIAVNDRALAQAKADGVSDKDREFEQDIQIQRQLADLIAEQHGLERGKRDETPKPTLSKQDIAEEDIVGRAQRVRPGEPSEKPLLEKAGQLQRAKEIATGRRHMTVTQARHVTALEALDKNAIKGSEGEKFREIARGVRGGEWSVPRARHEAGQEAKRLRNEAGIARQKADNASGTRAQAFRLEAQEHETSATRYDKLREDLLTSQTAEATDRFVNPPEPKKVTPAPVKAAPAKKATPRKATGTPAAKKAAPAKPARDATDIDQMTKDELLADPRAEGASKSWTKDRIKAHMRGETPAPAKRASAKKAAPAKAAPKPRRVPLAKGEEDDIAEEFFRQRPTEEQILARLDGLNLAELKRVARATRVKAPVEFHKTTTGLTIQEPKKLSADELRQHIASTIVGDRRQLGTTPPPRAPIVDTPAAQKPIDVPDRKDGFLDAWLKRDIQIPETSQGESINEIVDDISEGRITPDEGIRRLETEIDINSTDLIEMDRRLRGDLTPDQREDILARRTSLGRAVRADADTSKFLREHFKKEPAVTPDEVKVALQDAELTGGNGLSDNPDVRAAQIDNRLRDGIRRLRFQTEGLSEQTNWIPAGMSGKTWQRILRDKGSVFIADLRASLPDLSREEFDTGLTRIMRERQRGLNFFPLEAQAGLRDVDRKDGLKGPSGSVEHYIDIEDPNTLDLRPLPDTPEARNLGQMMQDMTPADVKDLKRQLKDQGYGDVDGDTGEEVFDNALKVIVKRELEDREAKRAAKLAPAPKAPDKPKPNLEGSKYQRIDARALAEGLDLRREQDVHMLDRIQKMLDGEDDVLGKNPTPAQIGRYLDTWRRGPGGPGTSAAYRRGVAGIAGSDPFLTDVEIKEWNRKLDEEIAPLLKSDEEWKKLADRLMNTRRQRAQDAVPEVKPRVTRDEKKDIATASELTGIPAEQLEARALAKKKAEAPPKQSAVQVVQTLDTINDRDEARTLLQGRTKPELLEILKASGFSGPRRASRATKADIVDDIVAGRVGSRLDREAIRETTSQVAREQRLQALQGGGEGGEGARPQLRVVGETNDEAKMRQNMEVLSRGGRRGIDEGVPLSGDPEGDNSIMHGDSATMNLAQAYAKKNRNGTANRLMELRRQISTQRGDDSKDLDGPQKMVDELKRLREAETDDQLRKKLDDAIKELDFPQTPVPDLPEGTPPALRQLLEDLNRIPVARAPKGSRLHGFTQTEDSPVEHIAQLIQRINNDKGQISIGEVEREIEDTLRRYHESIDGAYRMWGLSTRTENDNALRKQLQEWIQGLRKKADGGGGGDFSAPAPPGSRILTRRQLEKITAQRDLERAKAQLRSIPQNDTKKRQTAQAKLEDAQVRIDQRAPGRAGYNWKAPSWDEPAAYQVSRPPTRRELDEHISRLTSRPLLQEELTRQAALTPLSMLELRSVSEESPPFSENPNAYAVYDFRFKNIMFNPEWTDPRKRDLLLASWEFTKDTGFHPPSRGGATQEIIAHEYGHHLAYRALDLPRVDQGRLIASLDENLDGQGWMIREFRSGRSFQEVVDEFLKLYGIGRIESRVSGYGRKNHQELLAELWVEFSTMGERARPPAAQIGPVLRDLAEKLYIIR
jgi:hypothetical protein